MISFFKKKDVFSLAIIIVTFAPLVLQAMDQSPRWVDAKAIKKYNLPEGAYSFAFFDWNSSNNFDLDEKIQLQTDEVSNDTEFSQEQIVDVEMDHDEKQIDQALLAEWFKAARSCNIDRLKGLVNRSFDFDAQDQNGNTALHLFFISWKTIIQNHTNTKSLEKIENLFSSCVRQYLDFGTFHHRPSLGLNNDQGETPLILAVKNRAPIRCIQMLKADGADCFAKNSSGYCALDYIQKIPSENYRNMVVHALLPDENMKELQVLLLS